MNCRDYTLSLGNGQEEGILIGYKQNKQRYDRDLLCLLAYSAMSILVSGSLAYDYIMNFPDSFKNHIMPEQIHILNVCFVVDKLEKSWGGTAGNIAYTTKLLGAEPLIISAVGRDAREYLEHFKSRGIATDYIHKTKTRLTASAYITTDMDDNQVTAFYNGPLSETPKIPNKPLALAIISPTDKQVMITHLHECAGRGIPVMFDPGQQITAFTDIELRSLIDQSRLVIGNDYEMKLLQERTGWEATEILKHTEILITTLGEKGSVVATDAGEIVEVAPCPPDSFDDPTGAGDAFRAGFLVGFEKGFGLKTCAQMGSVAASYAIEAYGTQAHRFTINEFGERYKKCYGEKVKL